MKRVEMILVAVGVIGVAACDSSVTSPELAPDASLAAITADAAAGSSGVWVDQHREVIDSWGAHWVPCANDGAGEYVDFRGQLAITTQILVTDNGISYRFSFRPLQMFGTGRETGDVYQDVGAWREHYMNGNSGILGTSEEVYRMITLGSSSNFVYRVLYQVRITPDGQVVLDRLEESVSCS